MMHKLLLACFILIGCDSSKKGPHYLANSPEGIILRIEEAHRQHNLDSIIVNTDFETSARLMLSETKFPITDSTIFYMAEALKFSEIKQINEKGFWLVEKVNHRFSGKKFVNDSILSITDESSLTPQEILVVRRNKKWLYLGPK